MDVQIRPFVPVGSRRIGDLVFEKSVSGCELGINIAEADVEILAGCADFLGPRIEGLSNHLKVGVTPQKGLFVLTRRAE